MSNSFQVDLEIRRQHINLSNHANEIIELDMRRFSTKISKSGFINQIIANFYDEFVLSPTVVFDNLESKSLFNDFDFVEKETKLREYKKKLMETAIIKYKDRFESNNPFKLKLNIENAKLLAVIPYANVFDDHAPHYAGLSFYIKIILEDYAQRTVEKRENIYYKDTIKIVRDAINRQTKVSWINDGKREYLDLIYIGREARSKRIYVNGTKFQDQFASLHDSVLNTLPYNTQDIYKLDIKTLKEHNLKGSTKPIYEASKNNQPYIIDILNYKQETKQHKLDFILKFNKSGLERLNNEKYSFDFLVEETDNENEFKIKMSESDLYFNFFDYAFEMEVIEPKEVRDKFSLIYKKAYEVYSE